MFNSSCGERGGYRVLGNPSLKGSLEVRMKQYLVFNWADGVFASPNTMTLQEAEVFAREFPKRYVRQGYCLTASGERISPGAIGLEIEEA